MSTVYGYHKVEERQLDMSPEKHGSHPHPCSKNSQGFPASSGTPCQEAATLARTGNQQGAYYLAGFAVECALKACIAKKTRRHDFPADKDYASKVYSHNLDQLLKLSHLEPQLDIDMKSRPQLAKNWDLVRRWKVDSRYETSRLRGRDLTHAVNSPDGVLQWIKLHW